MKRLLAALFMLGAMALPLKAVAAQTPTFVTHSTFAAGGADVNVWAMANRSQAVEVRLERITVGSCNDGAAVAGGLAQYWLYGATSLVDGGVSQVSTYSFTGAEAFPASVQASTGPVNVVIEGKGSGMQNPLLGPFVVNNDETAAANFSESWDLRSEKTQPLILPKGGTRGLVLKQKKVGTGDITAGCVFVRAEFTAK